MSTPRALIVDEDSQRRRVTCEWLRSRGYEALEVSWERLEQEVRSEGGIGQQTSLRERVPELYQTLLSRYEEGVKQVLQHRIYKINDDAFEPFRQIARELFAAKATARDAIELHYHTLRKIAPQPDAPKAQAYLEIGRTTIIGLMGDLLAYYRDALSRATINGNSEQDTAAETAGNKAG
jgi:hypothetical protein